MSDREKIEKVLEMTMRMIEDDIKDSDWLVEYAEKADLLGDKVVSTAFMNRAKQRITTNLTESHNLFVTVMNQLKELDKLEESTQMQEGEKIVYKDKAESKCWAITHDKYRHWVDEIKRKIAVLETKNK